MADFDINDVINKLKTRRKIFFSEADFQLELGWVIKELYPDVKVYPEFAPQFNPEIHIDILVIQDGKWIPIELKYKTKKSSFTIDTIQYNLKNQLAKDSNSYLYLKDIQRIESVKKNVTKFQKGFAIFLTNELSYSRKPRKTDCFYKDFSLENGVIRTGTLNWSDEASEGTKKGREEPIILEGEYQMYWQNYSKIDETPAGTFIYLITQIS